MTFIQPQLKIVFLFHLFLFPLLYNVLRHLIQWLVFVRAIKIQNVVANTMLSSEFITSKLFALQ